MNIAAASIMQSQAQLQQNVGTAVMKKAMDTAEQNGSFVDKMMEGANQGNEAKQASPPHLGNRLDVRV
ncbi:MAG: YjfB family protein [Clostridiales bacterium]|nr:YjfB family protein [Clostridiales bacterium]MCF8021744.1 YjfB family protein [Clostridiales bacterium]